VRLLYLTNGFPYPLTSGYLRHYYFIRELSRHHEILLLSIVPADFRTENIEAMKPFAKRVSTFTSANKSRSFARKLAGRVRGLLGGSHAVDQMCAEVRGLAGAKAFDAALLSGKQTFPVLEQLRGLPLVVDLCDAASLRVRGAMRHAPLWMLPSLLLRLATVRRAERVLIQSASHLLFASCRDREALLDSSTNGHVIPNGVDLDYWKRSQRRRGENTVIFTGGMDYPPNVDAAVVLIRDVMPIVQEALPSARLLIVGRDPVPELVSAGKQAPGVTVTGFVEDVRPFLEKATVFVAPLRFGAGIQNKLLEALAMEMPVIASPLAADGLRTENGDLPPLEQAFEPDDLAGLIIRRLQEANKNVAPVPEARAFVERHFNWHKSGEKLHRLLVAAVDGSGAVPA